MWKCIPGCWVPFTGRFSACSFQYTSHRTTLCAGVAWVTSSSMWASFQMFLGDLFSAFQLSSHRWHQESLGPSPWLLGWHQVKDDGSSALCTQGTQWETTQCNLQQAAKTERYRTGGLQTEATHFLTILKAEKSKFKVLVDPIFSDGP